MSSNENSIKIVVIGGVAGGASAAARARRLSETAEIVVLERGEHPSFANCGMPYYVGGEIASRDKLLVAPIDMLRQRHRLDVRPRCEVVRIDREQQCVDFKRSDTGQVVTESYDKLIIATGASPFRPPLPGIDSSRVLELRDLSDADRMLAAATSGARRAVIVGGGFIGVEVAENLIHRGIETILIERGAQILSPWDREMIGPMLTRLCDKGVDVRLEESTTAFEETESGMRVHLESGQAIDAGFAVVCVGVHPESKLASEAGIEVGRRGGIVVNESMQTSDPNVYAVGDVTEGTCFVSKKTVQIPLAGPANRQGRIAADHIFGRSSTFRGTQGTAIVGAFGMTAAMTGLSEKALRGYEMRFEKIYIHPTDHAGYYPGAQQMTLKLLFDPDSGRIYGAQGIGTSGVDKRIDLVALAIQGGMTVFDLEEAELCYAPQYGHAKDPINMAGFVAAGVVRGDHPVAHWDSLDPKDGSFLLDVRSQPEFDAGHVPGAVNIPIEELRERTSELPKEQRIAAYCKVGQRGYLATRVINQLGLNAVNLSGGYRLWTMLSDST